MADEYGPGGVHRFSTPLDAAMADLAVCETAGKPNRGPMVDRYIRFVGYDPAAKPKGYHWCCCAFVYWCHEGGVIWVPKTASVWKLWELCKDRRSQKPRIGDGFVHLKADGTGHIGIVAAVSDDKVVTVEGNSNEKGSRVGNAVVRQERSRLSGYIRGYIRLDKERIITS